MKLDILRQMFTERVEVALDDGAIGTVENGLRVAVVGGSRGPPLQEIYLCIQDPLPDNNTTQGRLENIPALGEG